MLSENESAAVIVKRDENVHRWMLRTCAGWMQTPWTDDADAIQVSLWIKTLCDGRVTIQVE
ncbi:MAG: hypothetical protein ACLQDV_07500 [Candidatus Binataceae bacterium]